MTYTCRITLHTPEDFNRPAITPSLTIPHERSHPKFNFDLHFRFSSTHKPQADHVNALLKPINPPRAASKTPALPRQPAIVRMTSTPASSRTFIPPAMTRTLPPVGARAFQPFRPRHGVSSPVQTASRAPVITRAPAPIKQPVGRPRKTPVAQTTPQTSGPSSSLWSSFDSMISPPVQREERPDPGAGASSGLLGMVARLNRAASINKTRSRSRENSLSREGMIQNKPSKYKNICLIIAHYILSCR